MPKPGGPQSGPSHGRFNKTNRSLFGGKKRADAFPIGPGSAAGYAAQSQNLIYQNKIARASLRSQAAMVRQQYKFGRRGAIEAGRTAESELQGTMADRGIIGSTVNQAGIQDTRAGTQGEIQGLMMERTQGLTDIGNSRMEAAGQLRMGLTQLGMQKRAEQREMALRAFGSSGQNPYGY